MRPELRTGRNVDRVDVTRGMQEAATIGITDPNMLMLVEYCLSRWVKGEEDLADKTAVHMGLDFTAWRRILAAAVAAGKVTT